MKKFNIVACIIVLLLALISAACSYFLYEKRVQFVDGWTKMSTAINTSAKTIDKHGEKKFASKLTPDNLSHKNYANLDVQLKNLTDQSTAFVKQYEELVKNRDDLKATLEKTQAELTKSKNQCRQMAVVFAAISSKINANVGTVDNFSDNNLYSGYINRLKEKVSQLFDSRENIAKALTAMGRKEGFSIDRQKLFDNANSGLTPVSNKIGEHKRARTNYANSLKSIAGLTNAKFTDNGAVPSGVANGVRALNSKLNKAQSDLSAAQRTIGSLKNQVSSLNNKVKNLNKVIDDRNRALNLPPSMREPKVWPRASLDARSALVGKVIEVSKEYGYVVVDFGKKTTVKQVVGNKELYINPDIEVGLSFSVVRNDEFVAEIVLNKVGDNDSTAYLPAIKAKEIMVGDKVTFLHKIEKQGK